MRKILGDIIINDKIYKILSPPENFELVQVVVREDTYIPMYKSVNPIDNLYSFLKKHNIYEILEKIQSVLDRIPNDVPVYELKPVEVVSIEGVVYSLNPQMIGIDVRGVAIEDKEIWLVLPPDPYITLHECCHLVLYTLGYGSDVIGRTEAEIICDIATISAELYYKQRFDCLRYIRTPLEEIDRICREKLHTNIVETYLISGVIPYWLSTTAFKLKKPFNEVTIGDVLEIFKDKRHLLELEIKNEILYSSQYELIFTKIIEFFFRI